MTGFSDVFYYGIAIGLIFGVCVGLAAAAVMVNL